MKPERIILDWEGSPVERSIDWLLGESEGGTCIDLSHLWVITQTNGAAQRLREGLAQASQTQGSACLLPRFSAPGSLIKPDTDSIDGIPIASQVQVLAFWTQVVKDCDLTRFPHLFPQIPQSLDLAWGMSMAQALVGLRETLAEADHDCQSVEHTRLTEKWGEQDRWTAHRCEDDDVRQPQDKNSDPYQGETRGRRGGGKGAPDAVAAQALGRRDHPQRARLRAVRQVEREPGKRTKVQETKTPVREAQVHFLTETDRYIGCLR